MIYENLLNAKNIAMVYIPQSEYESLKVENAELSHKVDQLMEQLRLLQYRQFAPKREKNLPIPGQIVMDIFNEAEVCADESIPEPELSEVKQHYRKRSRLINDKLPEDLPVEIIEHTLPPEERICPECGEILDPIGKEERKVLKLIPASAIIEKHVYYSYGCRDCEENGTCAQIIKTPKEEPVIKGSFASPDAVAQIITQKYVMGAPLYRQEKDFERNGIMLSRQTMSNWMLKSTEDWLEPVYNALKSYLLSRDVIFADETVLQVLKEPGKKAQSKSYLWMYRTGRDSPFQSVVCEYQPDRKASHVAEFLSDYKGYIHTDGYSAYHNLPIEITVVGCHSHARRRFFDAVKGLKEKDREGSMAEKGVRYFDKLFEVERKVCSRTPTERYEKRLELAKPVLDEMHIWLKSLSPSPKSLLGKAVGYALGEWKYLERYLLDGRLEISNNLSERTLKSYVIDRKNFLFANTPRGAKSSAIMFSITETAKENGLNPFKWLVYIFNNAPKWNIKDNPEMVHKLMPDQVPAYCKAATPKYDE